MKIFEVPLRSYMHCLSESPYSSQTQDCSLICRIEFDPSHMNPQDPQYIRLPGQCLKS